MVKNGSNEMLICPFCGTNESDVFRSGFLGCEHCYELFLPIFSDKILNLKRATKHCGKRPVEVAFTVQDEYSRLNAELKKAVKVEDYQRAAAIQAQMRSLRHG